MIEATRCNRWARRWRTAAAMLGAGAAAVLALPLTAGAQTDGAAPAELGSYSLQAGAGGARIDLNPNVWGSVPDVAATFDTGAVGYGRASMAWPGPLGGNAGDLIVLASGDQIPPERRDTFRTLNYPVRAEARSPGGPPEASFDEAPGTVMTATASDSHADAAARVEQTEVPGLGAFGSTATDASTLLDGGTARSLSSSTVNDIELAGGLLTIGSVRSEATATSDGTNATATAGTVVSDVAVAGTPAIIDENGLRLGADGEGTPLGEVANEIASQALRESGMQVVVTQPQMEVDGASGRAVAGSLLIALSADGPFIVFGGASAQAVAGEAFVLPAPPAPRAPAAAAAAAALPTPEPRPTPPPARPAAAPATTAPAPQTEAAVAEVTPTVPITSAIGPGLPSAQFAGILAIGALLALGMSRAMRGLAAGGVGAGRCPLEGAP